MPAEAKRGYTRFGLAGAVALSLHILAAVLLFHWAGTPGAAVWAPDVISVNITPASVLDAISEQASEQQEAAPSPAVEEVRDVLKPVKAGEAPASGPKEDGKPVAAAAAVEPAPESVPVLASHVTQAVHAIPTPVERRPVRPMPEAAAKSAPDKPRRDKQPPQRQRHAAATGRSTNVRSGQVSAGRGNLSDYSAEVRARIARHRPGSLPHTGTATVTFAISGSGSLIYARLMRSSGNAAIDAAALQAVRAAAPFPPPPGGQTFNKAIPFYFR